MVVQSLVWCVWVEPKVVIQVDSVPLTHSDLIKIVRKESGDTMDTGERNGKTWESSPRLNPVNSFCISSFNLRGFSKNNSKIQMEKLLTATKFHDIIDMLDTHLNKNEVDVMVKNNKQIFEEFQAPILIPSQTPGIMVLLRKSCQFKLDRKAV